MRRPGVLSATVLAGVVAAVLGWSTAGTAASAPAQVRPQAREGGLRLISAIDVGGAPSSIVAAAGSLWVSIGMDGIVRIDPRTNRPVVNIRPGGAVIGLAAGFGAIWAIDVFSDRLLRIDPRTNLVSGTTPVGGLPTGIAIGHGSVWVANQLDTTVSRISPQTGRVLATIRLGTEEIWPGGIAASQDGVWVVTGGGNEVSLIDPKTATVDLRLPVPGARSLAVARGSLWVGRAAAASLVRIDRTGMVRSRRPASAPTRTAPRSPAELPCGSRFLGRSHGSGPAPAAASSSSSSPIATT